MRTLSTWLTAGALLILAGTVTAQTITVKPPVFKADFEDNEGGWMAMGSGKVFITHETADVKQGKGALQFDYTISKDTLDLLVLPTPDVTLVKAKTFRFWVKADDSAPLGIALSEKYGGRYMAVFSVPKDKWQQVELSVSDFLLMEDAGDPLDPNGKLDLGQVEGLGIVNVGAVMAQQGKSELTDLFKVKLGAHKLLLDDFEVTETPLQGGDSAVSTVKRLDTFTHPQIDWINIGEIKTSYATDGALPGKVLKAEYHQATGKPIGFFHRFTRGSLANTSALSLDIASLKPMKLLVQLEEKGGGKYNTLVDVPGSNVVKHIAIPFTDLKPSDDSKDANGKFDADQIHAIFIFDAIGMLGPVDADNTLLVNNIRATPGK